MEENHVNSGKLSKISSVGETILSEASLDSEERAETIPKGSRSQVTSKRVESIKCECGKDALWKGFCYKCYYANRRKTEDRHLWLSKEFPNGCVQCGSKNRKHQGHGLCVSCFSKANRYKYVEEARQRASEYYEKNQEKVRESQREKWRNFDEQQRTKKAKSAFKRKYDCNGVKAIERAEFKCEVCSYDSYQEVLQIHHKDRNRKNNDLDNLIVLCPTCHAEEHYANKWIVI